MRTKRWMATCVVALLGVTAVLAKDIRVVVFKVAQMHCEKCEKKVKDNMRFEMVNSDSTKTKILFVNDGSKDNSQHLIEKICANNDAFTFISFEKNCGLSAAVKAGFDYADTEWVGYIDADLQTAPEDFNILIEELIFLLPFKL